MDTHGHARLPPAFDCSVSIRVSRLPSYFPFQVNYQRITKEELLIIKNLFRILWKVLKWGIPLVVLLVAGWVGYLVYRSYAGLPEYDATVSSGKVQAEVQVIRDTWGVPHILADSEPDAYFALGYCMAQDRLFQMELLRRLGKGEIAEVLGPPVVKVDGIMRAFRLRSKAEEFVARMEKSI